VYVWGSSRKISTSRDKFIPVTRVEKNQWIVKDGAFRQFIAEKILDCLSDPDPLLRDAIAYEALSFWMAINN
jgi:hypothetical protein